MNPTTPGFFGRLASETPPFWKKVQTFALVMSALMGYLLKFNVIPQPILLVAAGIFAGIAFIAQCAVKDLNMLQGVVDNPSTLLTALPELINQVSEIHSKVTDPGTTTISETSAQLATEDPAAVAQVDVKTVKTKSK